MLARLLLLSTVADCIRVKQHYNVANNIFNTVKGSHAGPLSDSPHQLLTKDAFDAIYPPETPSSGVYGDYGELGVMQVDMEAKYVKKAADKMRDFIGPNKCTEDSVKVVTDIISNSFDPTFNNSRNEAARKSEAIPAGRVASRGIVDRLFADCNMWKPVEVTPGIIENVNDQSKYEAWWGETTAEDIEEQLASTYTRCSDWPINTPVQRWHNSALPLNDVAHLYTVINSKNKLVSTIPNARETNRDVQNRIVLWMMAWATKAAYAKSKKQAPGESCSDAWAAMESFFMGHILHTIQDAFPKGHAKRDFGSKADGMVYGCAGLDDSAQLKKMVISQFYSMDVQNPWSHGVYDSICELSEHGGPEKCVDPTATCARIVSKQVLNIMKTHDDLTETLHALREYLCTHVYPLKQGFGSVPAGGSPSEMTGNGFDIFPGKNTIGSRAAGKTETQKFNFVFATAEDLECAGIETKTKQKALLGCLKIRPAKKGEEGTGLETFTVTNDDLQNLQVKREDTARLSKLEAKLASANAQLESLQKSSSGDASELAEAKGKVSELKRKLAGAERKDLISKMKGWKNFPEHIPHNDQYAMCAHDAGSEEGKEHLKSLVEKMHADIFCDGTSGCVVKDKDDTALYELFRKTFEDEWQYRPTKANLAQGDCLSYGHATDSMEEGIINLVIGPEGSGRSYSVTRRHNKDLIEMVNPNDYELVERVRCTQDLAHRTFMAGECVSYTDIEGNNVGEVKGIEGKAGTAVNENIRGGKREYTVTRVTEIVNNKEVTEEVNVLGELMTIITCEEKASWDKTIREYKKGECVALGSSQDAVLGVVNGKLNAATGRKAQYSVLTKQGSEKRYGSQLGPRETCDGLKPLYYPGECVAWNTRAEKDQTRSKIDAEVANEADTKRWEEETLKQSATGAEALAPVESKEVWGFVYKNADNSKYLVWPFGGLAKHETKLKLVSADNLQALGLVDEANDFKCSDPKIFTSSYDGEEVDQDLRYFSEARSGVISPGRGQKVPKQHLKCYDDTCRQNKKDICVDVSICRTKPGTE